MLNSLVPSPSTQPEILQPIPMQMSDSDRQKYEEGFLQSLMQYIKSDEVLQHFHMRLVHECANVVQVINKATDMDILELEQIVYKLSSAKTFEALALRDSQFHQRLSAITGEKEFFKWWHIQSESLENFLVNFWNSIGYKTKQYEKLIELHQQIFMAIRNRNAEDALSAMQKHFALVLFQILGTLYLNKEEDKSSVDNRH
jgi:DNA-binding GntR family transcriptional regulator